MAKFTIRNRIEAIKRQKIASKKIVDIRDYRLLKFKSKEKHILVVNDDLGILSAIKRVLEYKGYVVFAARDGLELSRMLENMIIHMFILDISLPWVDGYELCKMLKSHPEYAHLPVVLLSSVVSNEDIEKGYKSGCDDYLIKPIDMHNILKVVDQSLSA